MNPSELEDEARDLFIKNHLEDARKLAEQALAIDGTLYLCHILLGEIYYALDRDDEAMAEYHRSVELEPERPEAYDAMADAIAVENLAKAEELQRYALRLALATSNMEKDDIYPYYWSLVLFLKDQGKRKEALDVIDEAADYFGESVRSDLHLYLDSEPREPRPDQQNGDGHV